MKMNRKTEESLFQDRWEEHCGGGGGELNHQEGLRPSQPKRKGKR